MKNPKEKPMKMLSVRVSEELFKRVKLHAVKNEISLQDLITRGIELVMREKPEVKS
jgi:predicted HicB family RNase H-like nuclease